MGCFLACFGFQKRRKKRRSPADGLTIADQIRLSYEPLDSSRITTFDTNDKLQIQNSKLRSPKSFGFVVRDRPKEQPWDKIRKKVSFNLNVQTYEPVPDDHYFLESDEEVETEEHCQEATARNYPQNHRYQNCEDCYYDDDEDDFAYGESDLDDSEIDEDHDELETNTVDRSQQVHSVLKPIENLAQWRTAKAGTFTKHQMKNKIKTSEQPQSTLFLTRSPLKPRSNSSLPNTRMQENLVHSSLSDWVSDLHKG